jgi:fumarylpyruvate hydrolase
MVGRDYVIQPPERPSLEVVGSEARFPVRRIHCVGRNYAAHVEEMGGSIERNPPIFFQKPADAVVASGATIPYPGMTDNFHHEVELVLAIGTAGRDLAEDRALDHVWGYGVGLDMTRRDIQGGGRPWEIAKAFDHSCPCGPLSPASGVGHVTSGRIALSVNGEVRQESELGLLIWKLPEIVARLSRYYALHPGDLILTGTPDGVGPVRPGDRLVATIDGLAPLEVSIGAQLRL